MSMTVCIGIQLRPPSVDLRMTKLMWLGASLLIAVRWSAPAISVPRTVRISEGMRYLADPAYPASNSAVVTIGGV